MAANTAYVLNYMRDGMAQTPLNIISDPTGNYILMGLNAAAYTAINVTAAGCISNDVAATLNDPAVPTLAAVGNNPSACNTTDGNIMLTFTNVADGTYTIQYEDATATAQVFTNVVISGGMATISGLGEGVYNNLNITTMGCTSSEDVDIILNHDCYSLGNRVFFDDDKNGDQTGAEGGIDGVQLQLLNSDGSVYDSDPITAGIQALIVTTANDGYYRFDELPAGDYRVEVLATNFDSGSPLNMLTSSMGINQEADPEFNVDLNDNGLDTPIAGAIRSGIINLAPNEPTGETEPANYAMGSTTGTGAADNFSNLTLDFGFVSVDADYPNEIPGFPPCPQQPCHAVDDDLKMGVIISGDDPNNNISDDADGTVFPNNLRAGTTIQIRTDITNNTGLDVYLHAWVDWNNDDDFDDTGENFIAAVYPAAMFSGTFTVSNPVFIPSTTSVNNQIAMRFRLSSEQAVNMNPCGGGACAVDGEVEDYLIQLECPQTICLPPNVQLNRK